MARRFALNPPSPNATNLDIVSTLRTWAVEINAFVTVLGEQPQQVTDGIVSGGLSVSGGSYFEITNTVATDLTDLTNGRKGQNATLKIDAKTTVVHDPAKIYLQGQSSITGPAVVSVWLGSDGVWYEEGVPMSSWVPVAVLHINAGGTVVNIMNAAQGGVGQAGTIANFAYEKVDADQRRGWVLSCVASAAANISANWFRASENLWPLFSALFAPAPTYEITDKSSYPSYRFETECYVEAVGAGQLITFIGFVGNIGGQPIGIGFAVSQTINGNLRYYAAVCDTGVGTPWPEVVARHVWVDTGIASTAMHAFRIEVGQQSGTPYISWQIDGVEVHAVSGTIATYPGASANQDIGWGAMCFRALGNSTDLIKLHGTGTVGRFYVRTAP